MIKVFVDFDGTITREDVGNAFFRTFGGTYCDELVRQYREGKISAKECFRGEVGAIGLLNKQAADQFVRSQPIDETFRDFVGFCKESGIECSIVSDGLDYYIREILAENELEGVSFYANHLEITERADGEKSSLAIRFPYDDEECTRCACCKRNIMLTLSGDEDVLVYVGEGFSDQCPAQYADLVFAKGELQTFCQKENISYAVYESFREIIDRLDTLQCRGLLRKRPRAELKRREVFLRG